MKGLPCGAPLLKGLFASLALFHLQLDVPLHSQAILQLVWGDEKRAPVPIPRHCRVLPVIPLHTLLVAR